MAVNPCDKRDVRHIFSVFRVDRENKKKIQ